ncbi:MAG: serine/threonine-protein kinase [Blastocatellia bacterium]
MTRETTQERRREKWRQTLDLFEQTLARPPAERDQFLDSVCAGDLALRTTVEAMVDSHQQAEIEGFMESPAWSYSPPDSNPRAMIGQQVGSYCLTQFIAEGGMGVVYLAEPADKFFRRQAAVKLIRADLDPKQYRRFRREVQILADLKHPNLVFLYEAGRIADGRPYLAMEYVKGENLRDWQQQRGVMPLPMIVEVVKQAGAGLSAAHEAGIIHRDIKPGNIIISENGGQLTVKVLDFGIAARKDDGGEMSRTQGVIGTVLYMSPEQLQGKRRDELTPASDIYSLGLTVYELLTGQPAISGNSQAEIIAGHLYNQPTPPSQLRPDLKIPAAIDRAVMKALAKDPNERYQSAPDFAAELEAGRREAERWNESTEALPPPQPVPPPEPPPVPVGAEKPVYAKAAVAVVAVGVVTAASYFIWQRESATPQPPPQTTVSPSPVSSLQPRMLKLLLTAQNAKGEPLAGSSLALFKEGITTLPAQISEENALILRTDNQGRGESKGADVKSGTYLMKAVRVGYKTLVQTVTLSEDKTRPGAATLLVRLEPE